MVCLDDYPMRIGAYPTVCKPENKKPFGEYLRLLEACKKRENLGGVLIILDGDSPWMCDGNGPVKGQQFCAKQAAQMLARVAREAGAGRLFSLAVVFACMEFESWFIPAADSLVGKHFSDNRIVLREPLPAIPSDPEAPRDTKGWLRKNLSMGYNPRREQQKLAQIVDLKLIREKMRSFRRLENAVRKLLNAIRTGKPISSPP